MKPWAGNNKIIAHHNDQTTKVGASGTMDAGSSISHAAVAQEFVLPPGHSGIAEIAMPSPVPVSWWMTRNLWDQKPSNMKLLTALTISNHPNCGNYGLYPEKSKVWAPSLGTKRSRITGIHRNKEIPIPFIFVMRTQSVQGFEPPHLKKKLFLTNSGGGATASTQEIPSHDQVTNVAITSQSNDPQPI